MARLYTSRALLDPSFFQMRQQADDAYLKRMQEQRNRLYDALTKGAESAGTLVAGSIGLGIDAYKKGKRQDEIEQYKESITNKRNNDLKEIESQIVKEQNAEKPDLSKIESLNKQYQILKDKPLFDMSEIGAMNDYIENADSSKFLTLRQIKEVEDARKLEEQKRKDEELDLKRRKFDLAKRDIESYSKPNERISAIKNAIDTGIAANQDVSELENLLEQEQEAKGKAEFIEKEKEWDKAQESKQSNIKKRTKDLIEEYVSRLEDIEDKDEYNQSLNELKTMAEANGLRSEIKFPDEKKKSRTQRTAKEEDEYQALLLDKKYNRMTIEKQQKLDKLSKLTPYKS